MADYCDYKHLMFNHGCAINPPVIDLSNGGANVINALNWVPFFTYDVLSFNWPAQQIRVQQGDGNYASNFWSSAGIYNTAGNLIVGLGHSFGYYQAISNAPFSSVGVAEFQLRAQHPAPYGCVSTFQLYRLGIPNLFIQVYYSQAESSPGANDGRLIFSVKLPTNWPTVPQYFIDWFEYNYGLTWPAGFNNPSISAISVQNLSLPFLTNLVGGPWAIDQIIDVQNIGLTSGYVYDIYTLDDVTNTVSLGSFLVP